MGLALQSSGHNAVVLIIVYLDCYLRNIPVGSEGFPCTQGLGVANGVKDLRSRGCRLVYTVP